MKKKRFLTHAKLFAAGIFSLLVFNSRAQIYNFSTCTATGRLGPSQLQVNAAYLSTNLNGTVTSNNGIQTWTVPATGVYRIRVAGASGGTGGFGPGGSGRIVTADFSLTSGTVLNIAIGQAGQASVNPAQYFCGGSGGGGSFVYTGAIGGAGLILAAGGGGGGLASSTMVVANINDGNYGTNGYSVTDAGGYIAAGGTGGTGGGFSNRTYISAAPGAGWISDYDPTFGNTYANMGGTRFNGGILSSSPNGNDGGFGGGGASGDNTNYSSQNYTWSGGGGGYSGGGAGHNGGQGDAQVGGGGGSFLSGTNQVDGGLNVGDGSVVITNLFSATITQSLTILCNGQSTASLTATPNGGSAPYTYSWAPTGGNLATATGLPAGTYTVTVLDASSNTTSQTFTVTQPTAIVLSAASQTNISCFGGGNGNASVTPASGGTGPYTYNWTPGNPTGDGTVSVTGLTSGTWTCTVTDANSCSTTRTFNITQPTAIISNVASQNNISCNGGSNGAASVTPATGGTGPYTYNWTPGNPTGDGTVAVTGLTLGTWTCTVTDANSCVTTQSFNITQPGILTSSSSATPILCNGGNSTVTVNGSGGTAPYTGTGTFTVTVGGPYSYTITDANGCTSTTTISLTEPSAISVSVVSVDATCFGGADGSINLTVTGGTGPFTFDWNSGMYNTEDLTGLIAGTYVGLLTDANGCTDGGTVVINEPTAVVATLTTATNPTSCGGTNGSIDITISGGTPGYTFLWNTSATTEDLTGIAAGAYNCTVTDTHGCTTQIGTSLSDPNAPIVTLAIVVDTVCTADGAYTLSGGSPAGGVYSGTAVTAGSFNPSVASAGMNFISYTYTDINGCTGSNTDSIYVDACTGVHANANKSNNFTLMPNPNNGTFTLQLNTTQVADLMIYDAMGQLVSKQNVQPYVLQQLNISNAGVYLIAVITADGHRTTQRVIVNK